ncbi:MAG: response regulator SirA [Clostridiaceae bacterium BRH_c20a]|nr:MAG: response regulator SirA [Clostridiaceae bacterium BRH_c20a]
MAEVRLDCLYEACPIPLLKTMQSLKVLNQGDVLIVETDHSCAIKNIAEWVGKQKLPCEIIEVSNGEWEIYIRKER